MTLKKRRNLKRFFFVFLVFFFFFFRKGCKVVIEIQKLTKREKFVSIRQRVASTFEIGLITQQHAFVSENEEEEEK